VQFPFHAVISADFQKAEKSFSRSLRGTQGKEDRWRACASSANAAMGFAVAPAFVAASPFSGRSRQMAHAMMREIKDAFKGEKMALVALEAYWMIGRLDNLEWLDTSTASRIRQKVDSATELFGYPDMVMNVSALDDAYSSLKISEREYFQNQVNV